MDIGIDRVDAHGLCLGLRHYWRYWSGQQEQMKRLIWKIGVQGTGTPARVSGCAHGFFTSDLGCYFQTAFGVA